MSMPNCGRCLFFHRDAKSLSQFNRLHPFPIFSMHEEQQRAQLRDGTLGDPFALPCNRAYMGIVANTFRTRAEAENGDPTPITVELKQSYYLWTTDKRTVRVHNMPAAFGNAFLVASTGVLRILHDTVVEVRRGTNFGSRNFPDLAMVFMTRHFANDPDLQTLCALGYGSSTQQLMVCLVDLMHDMVETGLGLAINGIPPVVGYLFGTALNAVATVGVAYVHLKTQKAKNAVRLLWALWQLLSEDIERIMNSNVLITAIDERDLLPTPWNPMRKNDGVWCDIRYMDLPFAPRLCEHRAAIVRQQLLDLQFEFRRLAQAVEVLIVTARTHA